MTTDPADPTPPEVIPPYDDPQPDTGHDPEPQPNPEPSAMDKVLGTPVVPDNVSTAPVVEPDLSSPITHPDAPPQSPDSSDTIQPHEVERDVTEDEPGEDSAPQANTPNVVADEHATPADEAVQATDTATAPPEPTDPTIPAVQSVPSDPIDPTGADPDAVTHPRDARTGIPTGTT